ncbi:hypothetical protein [Vulcanisaeta souniana]|uniref:Uncharacterized protein n=1 Tax=Vulcanisaeta souniana JCM 11219 TaxID=1293586 RepID=A0ABM8BPR6_9CREN|nr:hypothetical protein [Vulcanisaeta souniana]BDR93030.1 hypothetical protein Vsou_21230 [Vulcanisaeta souniana JCM 11219]
MSYRAPSEEVFNAWLGMVYELNKRQDLPPNTQPIFTEAYQSFTK